MARHAASGTGYIRRYIVECLGKRGEFNRKEIFLSLIVDPDPNVRAWVRGWYRTIEDVALRNKLLKILDVAKSPQVATDLITALGESQLRDTAELIFQRIINGNLKGAVLEWACRSLASLGFRNAIPYLMQTIQSSPASDLAGHALIAVGDLCAKEAMQLLFNLLESKKIGTNTNIHWLTYAFHHIAEQKDYVTLSDTLQESLNSTKANLSAFILAGTGDRSWDKLVFRYVLDGTIPEKLRFSVFQEWCGALAHPKCHQDNYIRINSGDFVTVSPDIIEHLHTMFIRNERLSSLALLVLINTSSDLKRVAQQVMLQFIDMASDFTHRSLLLCRHDQWTELGKLIRPWLHRQIEQANLSPQAANNWYELLRMVADHSTVDLLHRNRQRYNSLFGKGSVDALENRIRKGLTASPIGD